MQRQALFFLFILGITTAKLYKPRDLQGDIDFLKKSCQGHSDEVALRRNIWKEFLQLYHSEESMDTAKIEMRFFFKKLIQTIETTSLSLNEVGDLFLQEPLQLEQDCWENIKKFTTLKTYEI